MLARDAAMNDDRPDHHAPAAPVLTKSPRDGKLGPSSPPHAAPAGRIDALVAAVCEVAPAAARLVEIGYDRGAILLRALAARPDLHAVGIEIQPAARHMAVPDELAPRLTLLTGDGFDPLPPTSEPTVVLLAGLGGRTIASLLTRDPATTRALSALVLCPSHLEAEIRPALRSLGLRPSAERLVTERGRFYEIIVVAVGDTAPPDDVDRDPLTAAWGPRLFATRDPLLVPFLEDARHRFRAALAADLRSYRSGPRAALGAKLARLDEALALARSRR